MKPEIKSSTDRSDEIGSCVNYTIVYISRVRKKEMGSLSQYSTYFFDEKASKAMCDEDYRSKMIWVLKPY